MSKIEETDKKVIRFFSAIADPTRLKILRTLMESKKTVNGIYEELGREKMTLSAVSHQLSYLEKVGVIEFEKKGREKVFTTSKNFCWCIFRDAYKHYGEKCECKECAKAKK